MNPGKEHYTHESTALCNPEGASRTQKVVFTDFNITDFNIRK
jgi:hypothetical protein